MPRILYLHRDPSWAGFIADDLEILRERHEVEDLAFDYRPGAFLDVLRKTKKALAALLAHRDERLALAANKPGAGT